MFFFFKQKTAYEMVMSDWSSDVCSSDLRPAVLVGHSLGGVIAACVARSRPDLTRGVLLEDPPLFVGTRERDEANPFLVMFGLMRGVLTEMQARTATVEEYESLVRAAPSMNGRG